MKQNGPQLTGKVVVDAMGSDHAPQVEIDGALAAARDLGLVAILVGQPEKVLPELHRCGWRKQGDHGVEFVEAPEFISMDDSVATAVRKDRSVLSFGSVETGWSRHSQRSMSGIMTPPCFWPWSPIPQA